MRLPLSPVLVRAAPHIPRDTQTGPPWGSRGLTTCYSGLEGDCSPRALKGSRGKVERGHEWIPLALLQNDVISTQTPGQWVTISVVSQYVRHMKIYFTFARRAGPPTPRRARRAARRGMPLSRRFSTRSVSLEHWSVVTGALGAAGRAKSALNSPRLPDLAR